MKMLLNDDVCYAGPASGWVTIVADSSLIQQVMEVIGSADMGNAASLIRTYEASIGHYNETGECECLEEACECERELRIILKTGRLKRQFGIP